MPAIWAIRARRLCRACGGPAVSGITASARMVLGTLLLRWAALSAVPSAQHASGLALRRRVLPISLGILTGVVFKATRPIWSWRPVLRMASTQLELAVYSRQTVWWI